MHMFTQLIDFFKFEFQPNMDFCYHLVTFFTGRLLRYQVLRLPCHPYQHNPCLRIKADNANIWWNYKKVFIIIHWCIFKNVKTLLKRILKMLIFFNIYELWNCVFHLFCIHLRSNTPFWLQSYSICYENLNKYDVQSIIKRIVFY